MQKNINIKILSRKTSGTILSIFTSSGDSSFRMDGVVELEIEFSVLDCKSYFDSNIIAEYSSAKSRLDRICT